MKFPNPFSHKPLKYFAIAAGVMCLVYLLLRWLVFPSDPVLPFLTKVYEPYLYLTEGVANSLFRLFNSEVSIKDHEFVFENHEAYRTAYSKFLSNWPKWLLYKNWSALILVLIWGTISNLRKKLGFSIFFVITHFISVVSGLYLLGVVGPDLFVIKPNFPLSPTLFGTLVMFIFLVVWLKLSKEDILNTLHKLKLHFTLEDRKINEIIVLLFIFLLLRSFIIAFFDFPHYVYFLLETTRKVSLLWNHDGFIEGDQLIGEFGALALSKHCLAFMSMFLFASLVYLTRPKNNKITLIYLLSGLLLLQISNVIRLVVVFIVAQGEDGFNRANRHHDIYNIGVYILIFVMWIVWFEFFAGKKSSKSSTANP